MRYCKIICIRKKLIFRKTPRISLQHVQPHAALMTISRSGSLRGIGGLEALLRKITGHLPAAMLAKHILAWKRGEVYRTSRQIEEALGLTPDEIRAAKKVLPQIGIDCIVAPTRYGRATYYRVSIRRLLAAIQRAFNLGIMRLLSLLGIRGTAPDRSATRSPDRSVEIPQTIKHQENSQKTNIHDDDVPFAVFEIREPLGEGRDPLEQLGVNDPRLYGTEHAYVQAWIQYVNERSDIRNKAAYVAQAVRNRWAVPVKNVPAANQFAKTADNPFAGLKWGDLVNDVPDLPALPSWMEGVHA